MSRHVSLSLVVPIMFLIFFFIFNYQIVVTENQAFDTFCMEKIANYAADAAVEEILFTGDLGMDYADDHIDVQPDLALREYCYTMLLGMQMSTTDHNMEWLQSHNLKTFIVCAYDGFYVYQDAEQYTGDFAFISTPKIPYFYTAPDGTQYCLNLGFKEGRWDSIDGSGYRVNATDVLPSSVTYDIQLTAINTQVSQYLQHAVSMAYGGNYGKNYYLPAFASEISGGQPIKNITVIGIVDTNDKTTSRPNLCMSIGGARVVESDPILGFTLNGVKYYAHQSKLVGRLDPALVNKNFNTVYDAAKAGYHFFLQAYE